MLISPTFVPTTMKIAVNHITEQQQIQIVFSHHFLEKVINKIDKEANLKELFVVMDGSPCSLHSTLD